MSLPEKFLEKYWEMEHWELLEKLHEAEKASVKYKKESKSTEKESNSQIEELQKQIDDLKKGSQKSELDDFLKGKELSEDEKKSFDEMVKKGYDKEHALKLSTLDSETQKANQEAISRNELDWEDSIPWNSSQYTKKQISEMNQVEYNEFSDKYEAGKVTVVD